MTLITEQVRSSLSYLEKFFGAHHEDYRLIMHDVGGSRHGPGREPYKGFNDAIKYIRDVVLFAENEYSNLRIPEGFATPQLFLLRTQAFKEMCAQHMMKIDAIVNSNEGHWWDELSYAYKICGEVRHALEYALELAGVEPLVPSCDRLIRLLLRLPRVSRKLAKENRYAKRETLEIQDEYDVQDLMGAFLQLEFDDVRPEEWCPSYAGKSTRTDFLLKNEKILIEVKHATKTHSQKRIVDELTIDVASYKSKPDVKHLVCAIWDTDHFLDNPDALKADLENHNNGFVSVVVIK